jgi:Protein of unknown function (DUF3703)
MSFTARIRPFVEAELAESRHQRALGEAKAEFSFLERAHVLGQQFTTQDVRVHCLMLLRSVRNRAAKEFISQVVRIVGAATKTALGLVPKGNTGGANVSPFKPMSVPADLRQSSSPRATSDAYPSIERTFE